MRSGGKAGQDEGQVGGRNEKRWEGGTRCVMGGVKEVHGRDKITASVPLRVAAKA